MSATWVDIARKDYEDAIRSRLLWGVTVAFVTFLVVTMPAAEELFPEAATVDAALVLAGVGMLAQLFIPGIALVTGYMAVVGERQSGSLRILLSQPFSRRDVVAGKLLGRTMLTVTALLIGFAVASVLLLALYGTPTLSAFAGFVAAGVLLGLSFTGLAVGGSAAVGTRGRSMAYTVGPFVAMVFFWKPLAVGLYYGVYGKLPELAVEHWYLFVRRLNPLEAFRVLAGSALDESLEPIPNLPLENVPETLPRGALAVENRVSGDLPFYLQDWFAVVVLLAWGVVPVLIGYWRFERSELG